MKYLHAILCVALGTLPLSMVMVHLGESLRSERVERVAMGVFWVCITTLAVALFLAVAIGVIEGIAA